MTINLTTIREPFGLLDDETQAQLMVAEQAGMRIERFSFSGEWSVKLEDGFFPSVTYRLAPGQVWPKPEPKRAVRYLHLLGDGRVELDCLPNVGMWFKSPIIGRARVEVVEGRFDD